MAWYVKNYTCEDCGEEWEDEHCCACNDRCPSCDAETEPHEYHAAGYQGSCGDAACPDCARPDEEEEEAAADIRERGGKLYCLGRNEHVNPGWYVRPSDPLSYTPGAGDMHESATAAWEAWEQEQNG